MRNFERALLIKPDDSGALRGLARSKTLDDVLRRMAEASASESAGDLAAARRGFQAVLTVDGEWAPARASLARIDAALAANAFERDMARGLAALAAGRSAEARTAIDSALRAKPGDPGARSALEQLNGDERRGRIIGLQAEAERLAAAEQWSDAIARYEAVLAIDPTLVTAKSGLQQAEARATLHQKLERELARAERFNDDVIAGQARAVVAEASAVPAAGPVISGQVRRLNELLAAAAQPVAVQFESDNQTNVVIFKVGPLGIFANRTVELRPGPYVVVGTRDGYRDVRRTIRVEASGNMPPVVVRCEEPI
jgi:tetratricopeptide (TPR) repeat protein